MKLVNDTINVGLGNYFSFVIRLLGPLSYEMKYASVEKRLVIFERC